MTFPPILGHLTDLQIQATIFEVEFFNIIQLCHNLVTMTCQVATQLLGEPQIFHTGVIVLPNLKMMTIETTEVLHVLQEINAPCLKSLKYKCLCHFHDYNPISLSTPMLDGSLLSLIEKGASML